MPSPNSLVQLNLEHLLRTSFDSVFITNLERNIKMKKTTQKKTTPKSTKKNSNIVELPIIGYQLSNGKIESITFDKTKSTVHLLRCETSETGLSATCYAHIDSCFCHLNLSYRDAYKILFS